VGAGGLDADVARHHDAVEPGDRIVRVEAAAGVGEIEMGGEIAQAAAARRPFVEVAHQHGRHVHAPLLDLHHDRMRLAPPPQAGQVEVHADYAQARATRLDLAHHRAARLQAGQMERGAMAHVHALSHQDGVAVPAEAGGARAERHRLEVAMLVEQVGGIAASRSPKRRSASWSATMSAPSSFSTSMIRSGPAPAIGADRLADIVAGEAEHA
jgi:hypothetical protein